MVNTLQPIQVNELVLWLVHGHHVTANPGKRVGTMARPWSSRYSQSRETSWYYGSSMVITLQPIQVNELVLWLVHGHHVTANPEKGVGTMARIWSSRYSQSRERSWYYDSSMVITLQPIQINELVLWLVHGHHVTANPDKRVGTVARPWSSRYRLSRETRWYCG